MSNLFAYLSYRDVDAAITWLEALGFEPTTRQRGEGSVTVHAELRLGDAVVMVAPADEPRVAGASSRRKTEWGTERARVLDPEGYEWSFGTYEPGGPR
jgi:uncharacterized glyoxalase superfamily protein PhnB